MNKAQGLLLLVALNTFTASIAAAKADDDFAYFGAKMGYSLLSGDCFEAYTDCDESSIGYGIFAGYQFNSWFGTEIDAVDYGNYDATYQSSRFEDDIRGYAATLKFSVPLWRRAEGYLRAGGVYMNINRLSNSDSGVSPVAALGLAYKLKPSWILRTEYQYIADIEERAGHFATLGLSYRFGQDTPVTIKPVPVAILETPQVVEAPKVEPPKIEVVPEPKVVSKPKEVEATPVFRQEDVLKSEQLFFNNNSSVLTPAAKAELSRIAKLIRSKPGSNVWIQGYTDNTGNVKYNQWLSDRRATSVGKHLKELGIINIYTKGKGIASTAAPKVQNANDRKVVVSVTKPDEKLEDF